MSIVAVIPARYGSSRLEGKPLINIAGKTLIERVYNQVLKCKKIDDILVATDDERISDEVEGFGGNCVMTSSRHSSGTDRIWEAVAGGRYDYIVNVQGDEPLIEPDLIDKIAEALLNQCGDVVTPYFRNYNLNEFLSENCVKIVRDFKDYALYFSRSPIPFHRDSEFNYFLHHIGLYGYTYSALKKFVDKTPAVCEFNEKLEQLRFLENGDRIKLVETDTHSIGVDVPEDVLKVEKIINEKYD